MDVFPERLDYAVQLCFSTVIDDDDVELVAGIVHTGKSLKTLFELPWAIVSGYDDREDRFCVLHEPRLD